MDFALLNSAIASSPAAAGLRSVKINGGDHGLKVSKKAGGQAAADAYMTREVTAFLAAAATEHWHPRTCLAAAGGDGLYASALRLLRLSLPESRSRWRERLKAEYFS